MLKKLFRKKKFEILEERDDISINMMPRDTIALYYDDTELISSDITEKLHVDRAVIFKVENELGMEKGIGGAFGQKK